MRLRLVVLPTLDKKKPAAVSGLQTIFLEENSGDR
jgi:hypothetical protein